MITWLWRCASITAISLAFAAQVLAQTGVIEGIVRDGAGREPIPGVHVLMAGTLILPTREARVEGGLLADFAAHGRLALVALICYVIGWLPANARMNEGQFFSAPNWSNLGLAALMFVVFRSRNTRVQKVVTVVFFVVFACVLLFVYSVPGPERTP